MLNGGGQRLGFAERRWGNLALHQNGLSSSNFDLGEPSLIQSILRGGEVGCPAITSALRAEATGWYTPDGRGLGLI